MAVASVSREKFETVENCWRIMEENRRKKKSFGPPEPTNKRTKTDKCIYSNQLQMTAKK